MRLRRVGFGPARHVRRGVTLIEIVLSMGILGFLTSMTYWFYSSSLETSRIGTKNSQRLRLNRVVLDRMATEIRQAAAITADGRVGIRGEVERIWLSSFRVPSRDQSRKRTLTGEPRPAEYDLTKIEYKIARHPEILHEDGYEFPLGLARVEIQIPRPDSAQSGKAFADDRAGGGAGRGLSAEELEQERLFDAGEEEGGASLEPTIDWEELYVPEIRYLRFCYFDGHSWWDSWDVSGESPLPQLVQVTIGTVPRAPCFEALQDDEINEEFCTCLNEEPVDCEPLDDDQFTIVVRVPQADPLFRSRISRETQSLMEELAAGEEDEEETP